MTTKDEIWEKIGNDINIRKHDFEKEPLQITAEQIKESTKNSKVKEPRILCQHDSRESRPIIFQVLGLFMLPTKNGVYVIIKGEGYVNIPEINSEPEVHKSILDFVLETSKVGNSEMQHLDFAYASSIIRTFTNDPSLVLTIRGRKYTPEFSFKVSN